MEIRKNIVGKYCIILICAALGGLTGCADHNGAETDHTTAAVETMPSTTAAAASPSVSAVIEIASTTAPTIAPSAEGVQTTPAAAAPPAAEGTQTTPSTTAAKQAETTVLEPEQGEATDARREEYRNALESIYNYQVFPYGRDMGYDGYDLSVNQFAVYDVDSDGEDELLILYITTSTAGNVGIVYDFDSQSNKVREQLLEFPALRFYDNGIVEADMSHNHGLAGEALWPYTMYQYDKQSDSYRVVASVDAWDKAFHDTDYDGKPFPEEADTDGDGIVYYITPEGGSKAKPVDQAEYNKWKDSYTGGAKQLEIPFKSLTEENIRSLSR